ncbi:MAG: zinc ABC transporter substrate-binding protein [Actinomycetota bacterium]
MRTILVMLAIPVLVAACSSGARPAGSALPVVASTNVYGDIAAQIGGAHVDVTSILTDPNADPHLFEPGTRNGLAVSEARLLIENGVGYDGFMGRLANAAPSSNRIVVSIGAALSVHGRDANPHLWYDVSRLPQIAAAIADGLRRADPPHANAYRTGLRRFTNSLRPLDREVQTIRERFAGRAVAYTEPVPGYLLDAAGLRNLAPTAFTRAIENGTEPSPQAVAAMDDLVRKHRIAGLLYNSQAVSPITARIRAEATAAGIPVVGVTETLPSGLHFQKWQLRQGRALEGALSK